jgi:hypothetical protein
MPAGDLAAGVLGEDAAAGALVDLAAGVLDFATAVLDLATAGVEVLDLTAGVEVLDLTAGVEVLDLTAGVEVLDLTASVEVLDLTAGVEVLDLTASVEVLDLTAGEELDRAAGELAFAAGVDAPIVKDREGVCLAAVADELAAAGVDWATSFAGVASSDSGTRVKSSTSRRGRRIGRRAASAVVAAQSATHVESLIVVFGSAQ